MSEIAGNALHAAGYTNLAHLEGGMRAWEAAGGRLLHDGSDLAAPRWVTGSFTWWPFRSGACSGPR
jgi:hypothetical protein